MNWENIRIEYETSKLTLKELAEKHDIKLGTIKSRKSREKWIRGATKKDATPNKKVATRNLKKDATEETSTEEEVKVFNFLEESDLTDKQRIFCLYYVRSFNATQAAINAGYSPATSHVQGPRLLGNVRVQREIKRVKESMVNDLYVSAMDVLNKYVKIAFSDITDYLTYGKKHVPVMGAFGPIEDKNGQQVIEEVNYVDFKDSAFVDGTIISEVKQGRDGVSIKLEDRMKALEKLTLYFDLLPDKFKRRIEEEKLKIAHFKANGKEEEEFEDDGFIEALDGKEVNWDEEA